MRTKTLLLTAALSAAGVASSMAQGTVFSVNAVGYVNTTLKPGFNLISNPLTASDNSVAGLFSSLPFGTQVSKFDPATQKFATATYDDITSSWILPPGVTSMTVVPGEGVFVKNGGKVDLTVTFVGEVSQGNLSNPIPKGLSIKSSQVPQAGKLSTDLGYKATAGDQASQYNPVTQKFATFTFDDITNAWILGGVASEPSFAVGEAFFLKAAVATTWTRTFSVN
jgi:hypothetical protein